MGFDRERGATLSFPRVDRQRGEALSSWLARIARVHLLDLEHVEAEIGCRVCLVDHAPGEGVIERVAQRTGATPDAVREALHPLGTLAPPLNGELDWSVCPQCLEADREAGRPLYIRTDWTHPLVTVCLSHSAPLVVPTADEWSQLAGDTARPGRQDVLLAQVDCEPLDALIRAAHLVAGHTVEGVSARQLEQEVGDLTDALGVQMTRTMGQGAVLTLFEQPRRGRHIRASSLDLPEQLLTLLGPADRLLFVRAALALRWPSDGYAQERAVLGDWFSRVVHMAVPSGRRRVIGDQALDPLILVAMALPPRPFHQLRRRAMAWSEDLHQRWMVAEQLSALAGLT